MFKHNPHSVCRITSDFGPRVLPGHTSFHKGIDIGAVKAGIPNDPLYAVEDGIVKVAGVNNGGPTKGYGYYLIIEHKGFCTLYGHILKLEVKVGQVVKAGDIVAHMGNSGDSTGTHLHFEVRKCIASKYWNTDPVDPEILLVSEGKVMTVDQARAIVKAKAGLSDESIKYLMSFPKYGDTLIIKLAIAMGGGQNG